MNYYPLPVVGVLPHRGMLPGGGIGRYSSGVSPGRQQFLDYHPSWRVDSVAGLGALDPYSNIAQSVSQAFQTGDVAAAATWAGFSPTPTSSFNTTWLVVGGMAALGLGVLLLVGRR